MFKQIQEVFSPWVNLRVMNLLLLNSVAVGTAHICFRGSPVQLWKQNLKLRANFLILENSCLWKGIWSKHKEGNKPDSQSKRDSRINKLFLLTPFAYISCLYHQINLLMTCFHIKTPALALVYAQTDTRGSSSFKLGKLCVWCGLTSMVHIWISDHHMFNNQHIQETLNCCRQAGTGQKSWKHNINYNTDVA